MLNYKLQPRSLRKKSGNDDLVFPADVVVTATLSESPCLGSGTNGRTLVKGSQNRVFWNANTDRNTIEADPALAQLVGDFLSGRGEWSIEGSLLSFRASLNNEDELGQVFADLVYMLPGFLNLYLAEPITVVRVTVGVGDSTWGLEYTQSQSSWESGVDPSIQLERVKKSVRLLEGRASASARVQAAMHYFHVASRLLTVSESPWEFMPEAVLNMTKVLEVLFSSTRICANSNQQTRDELTRLGISTEQRERLISLMKLRSHMDVAHVDTWEHEPRALGGLYTLLYSAEMVMREMLRTLIERVESGEYELKPDWDPEPSSETQDLIEFLDSAYPFDSAKPGGAH